MATLASEGLFNFSQSFFSPDVLQRISREIDQPVEQTKTGLKSVIPTLLMGIVKKGSTQEGAESLISMAKSQVDQTTGTIKNNTNFSGSDFLHGIFGGNLNSIISKLGSTTGMNSYSVTKMMGVAAPLILGALGSKIKSENMNASSLMSFLSEQKGSLAALLPSSLSGLMSSGASFSGNSSTSTYSTSAPHVSSGINWKKILGLIVGVLFVLWLLSKLFYKNPSMVDPMADRVATIDQALVVPVDGLSALEEYLGANAATGALKRFRFETLNFSSGATTLTSGGKEEMSEIVRAMKAYPATTAIIEGYTDNVGPDYVNNKLSTDRAVEIKNQLVKAGIAPSRLQAVGMGSQNPVSSNTTAEGRLENRRIEFVIKH